MFFPNVNFLRAFAALRVPVYHVIELAPRPSLPAKGAPLTIRVGWVGVDLVVVITLPALSWQFFEDPVIQRFRRLRPGVAGNSRPTRRDPA